MAERRFVSFPFSDLYKIKQQVLSWSARFGTCSFLDNQQYPSTLPGYECLVAVGEIDRLETKSGTAFEELKRFSKTHTDWLFGHFSFDLKSETESSPSHLKDHIEFPELFFFVPQVLLLIEPHQVRIGLFDNNHQQIWEAIGSMPAEDMGKKPGPAFQVSSRMSRAEYIQVVRDLRRHILRGDCYEINFCQEFFVENAILDPLDIYREINRLSPSPFSAYYSVDHKYLLCASPERYLKRSAERIISQPIKGTAARNLQDTDADALLRSGLEASAKDRAENVMIVDLVRNDLSKICVPDSVRVSELFGIYSFAQVHQMISTIEGRLSAGLHWTDMIARTFPMGSMTGAPKKRVLELIEQYEKTRRGLFSGALGYVSPDGDFDFNVVIRSMLYNGRDQYLAWFAGSGITYNSDPQEEYEECLIKVAAFEALIKKTPPPAGRRALKLPS
jgi:para-aminobenzoate synthetase component I